jgi:hypothetical protein
MNVELNIYKLIKYSTMDYQIDPNVMIHFLSSTTLIVPNEGDIDLDFMLGVFFVCYIFTS